MFPSAPQIMQNLLLFSSLFLVFGVVRIDGWTFQTRPIVLAQNAINYTGTPLTSILHASPSQLYTNLNNRQITTAFNLVVPRGTAYDARGFEVDFVVGRRVINSRASFLFNWSISSLTIPLSIVLQVAADCGLPTPQPCGLLKQANLTLGLNASSIYIYSAQPWGNVFRASYIFPANPALGYALLLAAPSPNASGSFWVTTMGALVSQSTQTGYEYSFCLPVSNVVGSLMLIRDPDNILGQGYTNWTVASSIANTFYGSVAHPMAGYRIAAYVGMNSTVVPSSLTPSQTGVITSGSIVQTSAPSLRVSSPATNATNTSHNNSNIEPAGLLGPASVDPNTGQGKVLIVVISITIVLLAVSAFIAFVVYRHIRRRGRRAYSSLDDPLDEPNFPSTGRSPTSSPLYDSDKNRATAPLQLVGSRASSDGRAAQFDTNGNVIVESPREEGTPDLRALIGAAGILNPRE
jgi:hypothetical protein